MTSTKFNPAYVGQRPDIMALVPTDAKYVLDVGCSNGTAGADIKRAFNANVTGIETSEAMAEEAKAKLDHVIVGDVEQEAIQEQLRGQQFDVVIFADVLEHLRDPWIALENIKNNVRIGGVVIASIPNIRHIDTLFNLVVKGYWPYRDRGIHDKTHLRFFTRKNIIEMFSDAGLHIEKMDVNYRLIERPHSANRYAKYFAIPGLKEFLAFQFLVRARRLTFGQAVRRPLRASSMR